MASKRESNRPLYHRFLNKEAVNFRASVGKTLNDGSNVAAFAGELALNNPLGTYWPDYAQTGALELTVGEDAEVGGCDRVKITANGSGITFAASHTWKNIGSQALDTSNGAVNVLMLLMVSNSEINYSVKVNP